MKHLIVKLIEWGSLAGGILILGSGTVIGALGGYEEYDIFGGFIGAVGGFIVALIANAIVFGTVFVMLLVKGELSAIREQLAKSEESRHFALSRETTSTLEGGEDSTPRYDSTSLPGSIATSPEKHQMEQRGFTIRAIDRRYFLGISLFGLLASAAYYIASTFPARKTLDIASPKKRLSPSVKGDDYLRDLAERAYPKIEHVRVPLDTESLYFDLTTGRWKPKTLRRVLLRPAVGQDGILRWNSETLSALSIPDTVRIMDTYIVTENCTKCKYTECAAVCPVDAFREGKTMLVIDPEICINCGACEPECPARAIYPTSALAIDEAGRRRAGKWASMNRTYSAIWPVINEVKATPLSRSDGCKQVSLHHRRQETSSAP